MDKWRLLLLQHRQASITYSVGVFVYFDYSFQMAVQSMIVATSGQWPRANPYRMTSFLFMTSSRSAWKRITIATWSFVVSASSHAMLPKDAVNEGGWGPFDRSTPTCPPPARAEFPSPEHEQPSASRGRPVNERGSRRLMIQLRRTKISRHVRRTKPAENGAMRRHGRLQRRPFGGVRVLLPIIRLLI